MPQTISAAPESRVGRSQHTAVMPQERTGVPGSPGVALPSQAGGLSREGPWRGDRAYPGKGESGRPEQRGRRPEGLAGWTGLKLWPPPFASSSEAGGAATDFIWGSPVGLCPAPLFCCFCRTDRPPVNPGSRWDPQISWDACPDHCSPTTPRARRTAGAWKEAALMSADLPGAHRPPGTG